MSAITSVSRQFRKYSQPSRKSAVSESRTSVIITPLRIVSAWFTSNTTALISALAAAQPIDRIARPKVQRCGLIYGQRRARLPCETKRITFIIDTRPKQREQRAQIVPLLRARARRALKGKSSLCAPAAAPFKQQRAVHG